METILTDFTFKQEQKRDQIRNHINNIRSKLPANILAMQIGYLRELLEQSISTYDQVQEHTSSSMGVLANITNQTLNSHNITASAKVSRTDDGKICLQFTIAFDNCVHKRHSVMVFMLFACFFLYIWLLVLTEKTVFFPPSLLSIRFRTFSRILYRICCQ